MELEGDSTLKTIGMSFLLGAIIVGSVALLMHCSRMEQLEMAGPVCDYLEHNFKRLDANGDGVLIEQEVLVDERKQTRLVRYIVQNFNEIGHPVMSYPAKKTEVMILPDGGVLSYEVNTTAFLYVIEPVDIVRYRKRFTD